ncbi:alpha/beta fold hydrolase [Bacteriovorax sp. DB6_IX]|uniref:alpha/beta fold hydrolase n=1 Tax=Bacteriovorax sp. DB6_IX TaxID=1353530 RepID=UPI000389DF04|nr:alpha/beta hydrolase [Bacteriovorax sp. DB6_IX]EQC51922.1 Ndr family protein [Bacteriovorax sp. DB6_IX]
MQKSEVLVKKNCEIHYQIQGEGTPLLCISGFGCSNYNFDFIRELLAADFQLVLVDNRGMGKSSPVVHDYQIDDLAQDAVEIMDSLGHQKFAVMGISMGGFIAQKIALNFPERVSSLVLACTTSGGEDFPKLNKLDEQTIRRSFSLGAKVYNELVSKATVHPKTQREKPELLERIIDLRASHMPKLDQVLLQQRAVDKFLNETMELEKISCPTLVISGDEDRFVNPKSSLIFAEKIPNAKVQFIEESDHHFFLEKPRETADAVSQYLGSQL